MHQSLPLPFPVRDTGDLKRAIKYVSRASTHDHAARQYVIARARALGHTDLLPTSWTKMTTTQHEVTLDEQIEVLARNNSLSTTQLKTVYLRGVEDFLSSEITYGSATMYGLARVQRFINERGAVVDSDLSETSEEVQHTDHGIELVAGMFFSPDIVYSSGHQVAELFKPGEVTNMTISDEYLCVSGLLGSMQWTYMLNTVNGVTSFTVQ